LAKVKRLTDTGASTRTPVDHRRRGCVRHGQSPRAGVSALLQTARHGQLLFTARGGVLHQLDRCPLAPLIEMLDADRYDDITTRVGDNKHD